MQVEWTSYNSPIGALTVVECEAGPLAVEFPHRAMTIKWAVRLRAAVPELHIAQGTCRITTTWLDAYFAGSSRPFPYPDYLKRWFDLSPAQVAVFKTLGRFPSARLAPTTTSHEPPDSIPGRSGGWSRPIIWRSSFPVTGW